jgi:hypothetical protein
MKSLVVISLVFTVTVTVEAQVPKSYKTRGTGLWHSSDGVEVCLTRKMLDEQLKYKPKTCTTKYLKDTPTEYIAEVRCTDPSEGGRLTKITETWVSSDTVKRTIDMDGDVSVDVLKLVGQCN